MVSTTRKRQSGAAMFVAILMLVLMGFLGLAAMDTVGRDRQSAGFQNRSRGAFYAAEAGAAQGRSLVRTVGSRSDTPNLVQTDLGDVALYDWETDRPQFYPDPAFPNPIRYVADGAVAGGMNLQTGGTKYVETLWQINVTGQSVGVLGASSNTRASTARLEVVQAKVLSSGY